MGKDDFNFAVKRTQCDYSISFKVQVVREVESGELSVRDTLRKYGIQSPGSERFRKRLID